MDLKQSVKTASLNKSTYINLRWIGILGQFITINSVKFIFGFEFNFILSNVIIFIGALSNLYLIYFYKKPVLTSITSFNFLFLDIIQLSALLYLSGGILNPFSIFLLIPSVFASSNLNIKTNYSTTVSEERICFLSNHIRSRYSVIRNQENNTVIQTSHTSEIRNMSILKD